MRGTADYETNYTGLPFEDTLHRFRKVALLKILRASRSRKKLEIGPGSWPVCSDYPDFEQMVIVEPGAAFSKISNGRAQTIAGLKSIYGILRKSHKNWGMRT